MINNLTEVKNISPITINSKKSPSIFKAINPSRRKDYEDDGWEFVQSKLKKSIRMKKMKSHNVAFEEKVWALFAKMNFDYINLNDQFKIQYQNGLTKQIDVFAADDESIVFIECKSTQSRKKVSYQKDINELIGIKDKLRQAAQELFSGKQKVAFIFATNNAILSNNDRKRLAEDRIFHFSQNDIEYFEQLTDLLGSATKYQLFGKLFEGQRIPELKNRVPAIKGKVAAGYTFYSFCIEPKYLLKIGFILHRTETNRDSVMAYQRLVKKARLNSIGKYINEDGYFPNSIIINIQTKKNKDLRFEQASQIEHDSCTNMGILHLPQNYKSAFIIDGQHRLYGYAVTKSHSHHTIPVVAFHNLPPEEQTRIFVDINHTQKSVPANLLHSIMSDFHWNSNNDLEAISAIKTRLFTELSSDDRSPFYKRIILSEEKKTDKRCLTLQTIKSWGLNKVDFFGKLKGEKIIKTGYLTDVSHEQTLKKAVSFFNNSFQKIENDLEEQWELGSGFGGFIAMNIGVSALIRTMNSIIEYLVKYNNLHPENLNGDELGEQVKPYLDPITKFVKTLNIDGIKKLRSLFGSGATEKVMLEFQNAIHNKYNEYNPEGLEQWIRDNTGEFNAPAHEIGHNFIEQLIDEFIKYKLKEKFGESNQAWWIEGVPKEIQKKCSDNRIDAGTGEPDWNFLNTIHYYKIIEKHWGLLGKFFTRSGTENLKRSKKLEWLQKFNSIRQKYSHPQRENTTEEEYNFLVEIKVWLETSIG